jgi:cytochrome P450
MEVYPNSHTRKRVTARRGLNPFPWYEEMLREHPIHFDQEEQGWDLFRYHDVKQALLSPSLYSSERVKDAQDIISLDPPRHTQLRALIAQVLPQCLPSSTRIKRLVYALLDAKKSDCLDIIGDLALPLPIRVIADILGVPPEDHPLITSLSKTFVSATGRDAFISLGQYFHSLIKQKYSNPGNDFISKLLEADTHSPLLTAQAIAANCTIVI